jgi:alkylhydroperoxidase family enzyme
MPRIAVPDGQDPLIHLWTGHAPGLAGPASVFSDAVYRRSTLPLREFEAARITIAEVNDCNLCLNWRTARDVPDREARGPEPDEAFYDDVLGARATLSEREWLAADFARKFATDHLAIDEALWDRLHASFTDDELVELALCVGSWIAFGRLNQVFDVDGACRVPVASGFPG